MHIDEVGSPSKATVTPSYFPLSFCSTRDVDRYVSKTSPLLLMTDGKRMTDNTRNTMNEQTAEVTFLDPFLQHVGVPRSVISPVQAPPFRIMADMPIGAAKMTDHAMTDTDLTFLCDAPLRSIPQATSLPVFSDFSNFLHKCDIQAKLLINYLSPNFFPNFLRTSATAAHELRSLASLVSPLNVYDLATPLTVHDVPSVITPNSVQDIFPRSAFLQELGDSDANCSVVGPEPSKRINSMNIQVLRPRHLSVGAHETFPPGEDQPIPLIFPLPQNEDTTIFQPSPNEHQTFSAMPQNEDPPFSCFSTKRLTPQALTVTQHQITVKGRQVAIFQSSSVSSSSPAEP